MKLTDGFIFINQLLLLLLLLLLITSHYTAVNYTYMRSEVYCTEVLIAVIAMPLA